MVRIIRVLAVANDPLSRGEIATRSGLHPSGVPRVLERLEDQGIIEAIGQGRSRPIRLRVQHPVGHLLRQLFQAEQMRVMRVIAELKGAVSALQPIPASAWIEGPVATETDESLDSITVGVLADSPESEGWSEQLRRRFNTLQSAEDIAVEIRIWWRADILTVSDQERSMLTTVVPLLGPTPLDVLGISTEAADAQARARRFTHDLHDATSQRFASAIARQLRNRPGLVADTIQYLERRIPAASPREALELREWLGILTSYSPSRLRKFLVQDSERATRLRQSLPFIHVLTDNERRALRVETDAAPTA